MALVLPMCFKKPKLPPKSAEDIKTEEDLKAMRAAQQRQIEQGITEQKDFQTEASFARTMGMTGNRSLIAGPKGGSGYIGNNTGRTTGNVTGGAPIAPALTPRTPTPTTGPSGFSGIYAGFNGFPGLYQFVNSSLIKNVGTAFTNAARSK
ncbi:hypothetical protein UFOVP616_31 [uncultured Caudovirales phage]|uniref:Uncharacterized protein n=1 Tax=uncultured Caudovirales phage TaxID=2100421 RepID=A0A6J5N475_9CAUD|nr:hypothetical protein UFOVP616_31 [uncultured Caudovirales phage]